MVRYIEENSEDLHTVIEPLPSGYLTLIVDDRLGHTFPLRGQVKLGRDKGNAVVTTDQKVSRHHATLKPMDDTFVISDEGSANGTYINGVRIAQPTRLKHNDKISFGDTLFLFTTTPPEQLESEPPSVSKQAALSPSAQELFQPVVAKTNTPYWAAIGCMALVIIALLMLVATLLGIFIGRIQLTLLILSPLWLT